MSPRAGARCSAPVLAPGCCSWSPGILVAAAARSSTGGCCRTSATCPQAAGRAGGARRADLGARPASSARCCARPPTRSSGSWAARRPSGAARARRARQDRPRVPRPAGGVGAGRRSRSPRRTSCSGALTRRGGVLSSVLLCRSAFVVGVLARDHHLTVAGQAAGARGSSPSSRRRRAAGAGGRRRARARSPRSTGSYAQPAASSRPTSARCWPTVRTGEPVAAAFDGLAAAPASRWWPGSPQGVAVAVERGTPLADVLHAQAADVREAGRRELIEAAARKEVAMMVPVVFLVLPVTVLFAFFPGVDRPAA